MTRFQLSDDKLGGAELLGRLRRLIVDLTDHDILRLMDVDSELDDFGGGFSLLR